MKFGRRAALDIGLIAALLLGAGFLPPDTALRDRQRHGVLRLCVADAASPLIAGPDGAPGPELAALRGAAARLGLTVRVQEVASIGRSFNPRDWQVARGQCDLLGGGLADSTVNRDFLTLIPTGQRIALQRLGVGPPPPRGGRIGVMVGAAGFDRVALSSWIRAQGWRAVPLADAARLAQWLGQGGQAIAPSLVPVPEATPVHDLPPEAAQASRLAFGLWRGDMTLTRALRRALAAPG